MKNMNEAIGHMKRILIFSMLTVGAVFGAWAQQSMQVESFRLLENDLTANRYGTSKTDDNGETAALIKLVTPETGFNFDGGSLGVVAVEQKAGEVWLYVPGRAQRLTISHASFGVLRNYVYPIPIENGRTYEMLLDIGVGRYVSLTTQVADAEVVIDGRHAGHAPIYNRYLSFGTHKIEATAGRFEGTLNLDINPMTERGKVVQIPMQDMSHTYGDVVVSTEPNTDILFQGRKVGTGQWKTQLKEGSYSIVTARHDADSAQTSFRVERGQSNEVQAAPPIQHTGYLQVYTRPRNVQAVFDGRTPIDFSLSQSVPVGRHEVQYSRKGYVGQTRSYDILRNQTSRDTIQLERVTYVKPLAFYFGAGYTIRSLGGLTAIAGVVFHNHDLQVGYTFGLSKSDPVYWYDNTSGSWLSTVTYKRHSLNVRYGYQFNLMRKMAITPQAGYSLDMLHGSISEGEGNYGDGGKASCLSLSVKLLLVPIQHFYVFVAPEYAFALSRDTYYKHTAEVSNFSAGGFSVSAGLLFSF